MDKEPILLAVINSKKPFYQGVTGCPMAQRACSRAWERAVSAWSHAPLSMARAMRKRPGARRFLRVSALSCQTRAQAIVN